MQPSKIARKGSFVVALDLLYANGLADLTIFPP
jgi:hypothetical protein